MCIRIQLSHATVKALQSRLQRASQCDDVRLVRRTTVLSDLLVPHVPVAVLSERWGLSPACIYGWQQAWLLRGMDSLVSRHGGGRRPPLPPRQKQRWGELSEAGPPVVGLETACGHAVCSRVLRGRECGVLSNRHAVGTLLHNVGCLLQKVRFGSDQLDAAQRLAWLEQPWPTIVRAAKRRQGLRVWEDEASLAPWGSWSYTGARRGQQPEVPPSGTRKGYQVFGAIASFSGRLFYQGIEGRLQADSSQACVQMMRAQTTQPLFLLHDGARSHPRASPQALLSAHRDRSTAEPVPAYAPDDHPLAYLWPKTKQRATHHKYFKEFAALTVSVETALASLATQPDTV